MQKGLLVLGSLLAATGSSAFAGTYEVVHFLSPGAFAVGVEPVVSLSQGAGVGANLSYTQGLNELMNFSAILGSSSGDRKFRLGGRLTFDFFPDVEGQPGIGIAASTVYQRFATSGQLEMAAIPYIHKSFNIGKGDVAEPFVSLPFGMAFSEGKYQSISSLSLGSFFKASENLRYLVEMSVAINNTQTSISGGVVYYH